MSASPRIQTGPRHAAVAAFEGRLRGAVTRADLQPFTATVLGLVFRRIHGDPTRKAPARLLATLAQVHLAAKGREDGTLDAETARAQLRRLEADLMAPLASGLRGLHLEGDPQGIAQALLHHA